MPNLSATHSTSDTECIRKTLAGLTCKTREQTVTHFIKIFKDMTLPHVGGERKVETELYIGCTIQIITDKLF